jgi:secreted trypsin-like serine protease
MKSWSQIALCLGLALSAACAQPLEEEGIEIGDTSQEIVGGVATSEYPAVAFLYSEFSNSDDAQLCSGTLVTPSVILTAAHCVEFANGSPEQYLAYFGTNVLVEADTGEIDTIPIKAYDFHPAWNIDNLEAGNDIGMVALERPVPAAVQPVPINREPLEDHIGEEVQLVGWGRTSGEGQDFGVKRETTSTLENTQELLIQYGSATANTCQGDSGGPNFMTVGGVEVIAGITSYGNVGCNDYGVGTRVDRFTEFIDDFILRHDPSNAPPPGSGTGNGNTSPAESGGAAAQEAGAPVNGGCSAASQSGPQAALALLVLLAMSGLRPVRRVRARRS